MVTAGILGRALLRAREALVGWYIQGHKAAPEVAVAIGGLGGLAGVRQGQVIQSCSVPAGLVQAVRL